MGLDITVVAKRPIKCPDCGKLVCYEAMGEGLNTGGRCLMAFLEDIGYGDDQYGEYVPLSPEQAKAFADTCIREERYPARDIDYMVEYAVEKGYTVFLEADW